MKSFNFNINKIFPFLPLKLKLIIAFALLSSVPLFIVGIIGINNSIDRMREIALENLSHDVTIFNERAQNFISNVDVDIFYLINNKSLDHLLSNINNGTNNNWDSYSNFILNFSKSHKIYYQFRFVDLRGDEKFRIQNVSGSYKIYKSDSLKQGGLEFYFNLTKDSHKNSIKIIPAELIGPDNTRVPAISFATPVYNNKNQYEGIFIADMFAQKFFKVLEQKVQLNFGKEIAIINNEGRYLYNSKEKKNWNKLLAEQSTDNIFTKYSSTKNIVSGKTGILNIASDQIIAYAPLFVSSFKGGSSYFIYESVDQKYIFGPAKKFAVISMSVILLFLFISISFAIIATNQIAKPIQELKKGAEIISEGNYSYKLAIQTNDEIEQLAYQFNKMAKALDEREQLLKRNKVELEKTVIERTQELKIEKEKLQAVLDNVPSAFLLMDDKCRIISASSAIKSIANLEPDELVGKNCTDIFNNELFCKNCQLKRPLNDFMENSFIESKYTSNGEERFIEHTTVPIRRDHNRNAVLEILTDVTERKKTEEHLLKLEKLITIGETSALIAHEIRNSLTSVKMLLQLQRENSVIEDEKNSLDFSLNSIHRMERVINNLLSIGHQVEYKLTYINIEEILDESVLLLKPRLEKSKINLTKEIADDIPPLYIDANQFKETVTNLLINSIHAIGNSGEIKIVSKIGILENELTDFGYIGSESDKKYNHEYKIKLQKGEKIIYLEIADNGKGISRKNINKIFDPFFTTKENGTGLGLVMVKKTINNHGGIVQVKSELNKGTLIRLLLPVKRNV